MRRHVHIYIFCTNLRCASTISLNLALQVEKKNDTNKGTMDSELANFRLRFVMSRQHRMVKILRLSSGQESSLIHKPSLKRKYREERIRIIITVDLYKHHYSNAVTRDFSREVWQSAVNQPNCAPRMHFLDSKPYSTNHHRRVHEFLLRHRKNSRLQFSVFRTMGFECVSDALKKFLNIKVHFATFFELLSITRKTFKINFIIQIDFLV